jgi:hypothetical protein
MLPRREITTGKCYVNQSRQVAREVLRADHRTVKYNTYELGTGKLCGMPHECRKDKFIHWADREASAAETAALQYDEAEALFNATSGYVRSQDLERSMAVEAAALMMKNNLINR